MSASDPPRSEFPGRAIRLAVVNSHPIQYFAPLYAFLNADPRFEVTALYLSDLSLRGGRDRGFGQAIKWDIDLLAGYEAKFMGPRAKLRTPGGFFSLIAPEIWNAVRSGNFDAVLIHGHSHAANLIAMAAAKSAGIPVMIRGETHLGLARSELKRLIRRPVMSAFYRLIDRHLAIGSANADYYRAMGVPERKIFRVPYTVDNDRFIAASRLTAAERESWRTRFGIPAGIPAILYAAKFSPRKHPDDVLKAALMIREMTGEPFSVVMCGSGELEQDLRDYCKAHELRNVVFPGFVNQAELPKLYGACDAFVLPSENEPWGLAINEAMCAALPIVASREIGCVADLVVEDLNGFTPAAGDVEGLARSLRRLISDSGLRQRHGAASLDRIRTWSYHECLAGLEAAMADLVPIRSGVAVASQDRTSHAGRSAA